MPISDLAGDIEITRAQNRNYALGDGFYRVAQQANTFSPLPSCRRRNRPVSKRCGPNYQRNPFWRSNPKKKNCLCLAGRTRFSPPTEPGAPRQFGCPHNNQLPVLSRADFSGARGPLHYGHGSELCERMRLTTAA